MILRHSLLGWDSCVMNRKAFGMNPGKGSSSSSPPRPSSSSLGSSVRSWLVVSACRSSARSWARAPVPPLDSAAIIHSDMLCGTGYRGWLDPRYAAWGTGVCPPGTCPVRWPPGTWRGVTTCLWWWSLRGGVSAMAEHCLPCLTGGPSSQGLTRSHRGSPRLTPTHKLHDEPQ